MFKSNLKKISKAWFKSEKQQSSLNSIKLLYESQENPIKLFNDYSSIISKDKYKTKYAEVIKISTPKQMVQRLPIALAQVNSGNTSKNLLNEIIINSQFIYFLYQAKKITKKVYNNIVNSVNV